MGALAKSIDDLVKELSPNAQAQVKDFVEFLLTKQVRRRGGILRQDWAGALSDYREQYTSMELQKKALEWRSD